MAGGVRCGCNDRGTRQSECCLPETHGTEGVLKVAVAEIRKALNDVNRSPRFIETAHRRGYRFIGGMDGEETGNAPPGIRAVEREHALDQLRSMGNGRWFS